MKLKKRQIPWWRTTFGETEIAGVSASIRNEHISQGPVTAELESKIAAAIDVPYALCTTSGSVALLLAMMTLGIKRGDEVILPNRTWIATAHAPLILGAKVVLVDVRPDIPVMDVSQVRKKITSRTRAIVPVHLCGRSVDMDDIRKIAKERGILVIEDSCQAFFSRNSRGYLGTQSDAGCLSMGMTKLISTGQGGVVVMRDRKIYERMKLVRNHGVIDSFDPTYSRISCNLRFTDVLAAIGLAQLKRVPDRLKHIRAVYDKYEAGLRDLPFARLIPVKVRDGEVPLYVEILSRKRKELMAFLRARGIDVRPFLPDLCMAPYLRTREKFPNSRVFCGQGFFLPSGPGQPLANVKRVIVTLREFKYR